ncbi:Delta(14)-sterol reductase LBR [Anthophora plagiata]
MRFSEGEEVLVKNPNTEEYRKAKILNMRGERYKVQFETGIEQYVNAMDIKFHETRTSRSTTRTSSRNRKSPSRYSPARRSSRKRSPGKSPSSVNKQTTRTPKFARVSLPRIDVPTETLGEDDTVNIKNTKDENLIESIPLQLRLKELGTVTRRSTRLLSGTLKPETDHKMVMLTRNINRAVSLPLERKSQMPDFKIDGKERGLSVERNHDLLKTTSYEENEDTNTQVTEKRQKEISMVSEPQEWGGWLGAIALIFLSPLITILPQLMCTENRCTFGYPEIPTNLHSYINFEAFTMYLGLFLFVTIVSITPIGRNVDGSQSRIGRLQYRLNGFLCCILTTLLFTMSVYKKLGINDLIIENYVQLAISGWILGVILSLLLFIKGGRAPVANLNIQGSTNSVIYNYWQGREINPRIGPVDFKINLFRTSMIAMILINMSIAGEVIEVAETYSLEHLNIGVLLATLLQIIYAMDALLFESAMLTTFEVMYEGTGYMLCTGYMLYPFLPTLTTRYILYHKTQYVYYFILPILTFIVGYLLYRISNSQKDTFRKNPLAASLAHLETIPSIRGKKLIISGLWGHVRHPNYLGDMIIWWSISCISLACDILPYYYAILCTGLLIHRAIRDNERCKRRYGLAWEVYMSRVKYMILYRIF